MGAIKFRAWDTLNKQWLNLQEITLAFDGAVMAVSDMDGEVYGLHQVKLCQYTGLIDKQGKEVYEGDVVRGTYHLLTRGFIQVTAQVVYSEGFAVWDAYCLSFRQPLWHYRDDMVVIGNIYENPYLVKEVRQC